jgi:molybdopterin-containing oxidoreductase family membrane subunit
LIQDQAKAIPASDDAPLIGGKHTFATLTNKISGIIETKTPPMWLIVTMFFGSLALMFFGIIVYLITTGIGVWGLQIPVGWGFDIVNFVFWVGIGHAGTIISAILFCSDSAGGLR